MILIPFHPRVDNNCILMKLNITLIKSIDLAEVSRNGLFNTLIQTSHKDSGYILAYSSSVNSISPKVYDLLRKERNKKEVH